jgi:membrane protease YdiL (CAAX protease family)
LGRVALGAVSAILLYFVFVGGREVARLLPFGASGIRSIYSLSESLSPVVIAVLLVFPIAVGEEVYWRGTIQTQITRRYGRPVGFAITVVANVTVHLPAANPMLLVAAFVSSLVWGYLFLATNDLAPSLVSHVLWDLLVFVVFPLNL